MSQDRNGVASRSGVGDALSLASRVVHTSQTASTQLDASAAHSTGVFVPTWFTTSQQTAGVGRRGREWTHPSGSFAGTLLWPILREDQRFPALFAFLASMAVRDSLVKVGVPEQKLATKWPNDVLCDGAKIAGVLTSLADHPSRPAVLIGIGVNIESAPKLADRATISVIEAGGQVTAAALTEILDMAIRAIWKNYRINGFQAVRDAWLAHAAGVGQPIVVRLENETKEGVFDGLTADGRLCLRQGDQIEEIAAADVFFGPNRA